VYGKNALQTVRDDPYLLARTIYGIGFRTADTIAEKLAIPRNSIQRARAAVVYLLERMADDGHVYAPFEYLEGQFEQALEMDTELAARAVEELKQSGEVVAEPAGEHTAVYLKRLYDSEINVTTKIRQLTKGRPIGRNVVERATAAAERANQITLSSNSGARCGPHCRARSR